MSEPVQLAKRILIADDDPVFLSLATASLSAANFAVTSAYNGADALEILQHQTFDTAIIDLDMPRIDGLRLIGLLRGMPSCRKLAILVISASQDSKTYKEARRLGADAFLTKPVDWSMLPVTVEQVWSKKIRSQHSTMLGCGAGAVRRI